MSLKDSFKVNSCYYLHDISQFNIGRQTFGFSTLQSGKELPFFDPSVGSCHGSNSQKRNLESPIFDVMISIIFVSSSNTINVNLQVDKMQILFFCCHKKLC